MDVEKLIDKLRIESLYKDKCALEIMDLCMESADTIEHLTSENARLRGDLVVAKKLIEAERKPPADLFAELSDDDKRKAEILAMRDMVAIKDKENARMTAERDAAVEQLHGQCDYCKHMDRWLEGPCKGCVWFAAKEFIEGDYWEWIGSGKEAQ